MDANWLFGQDSALIYAGVVSALTFIRYVIIAGLAYGILWVWKKDSFAHRRIQETFPKAAKMWKEFKYSVITIGIFSLSGMLVFKLYKLGIAQIYLDINQYGIWYFIGSSVFIILLHDVYFYWIHRFMHLKPVFKHVHRLHHESTNPSPWAAFSFHPLEAVLEMGFIPLIVPFFPIHYSSILIFVLYMTIFNVIAHLGYEFYPAGFTRHKLFRWIATSTHHNMHHHKVHCNYGFYLNIWDRLMGTVHEDYHDRFDEIKSREKKQPIPVGENLKDVTF